MSSVQDHPDIEKLDEYIDGIPVRETIREIFRNSENGTPDNISKAGCLALALKSNEVGGDVKGYVVWNAWRGVFPSRRDDFSRKNCANFEAVNFSDRSIGEVSFRRFDFGRRASFKSANFHKKISFIDAKFGDFSTFHQAKFLKGANFRSSAQNDNGSFLRIRFSGCRFKGEADFSNRSFLGSSSFKGANFDEPPRFHGCELHQDTSFDGAQFPPASGSEEAARAYRTLKLAFSKQQAIREEQRFFRLEMEEETLRETGLKRWLFLAYKTFSDYGFSVVLHLIYLLLIPLIPLVLMSLLYGLCVEVHVLRQYQWIQDVPVSYLWDWMKWSLLSGFPIPGIDMAKELRTCLFGTGTGLSFLAFLFEGVHKTLSLAALFLIGLALRNLFKLK